MPHDCPVDVWTVALDAPYARLLTPDEEARAARFHFERDRVRWGCAHSALRKVLSGYLDTAPLDLVFETGPHGKPSVKGLEFNLSHSAGFAMIAVSRCSAVGIDIERIRENVDIAKLLERVGERDVVGTQAELFQQWARREAKTKALGMPLMQAPVGEFGMADLQAPEGFAAALAMPGRNPIVSYRGGGV